MIVFYLVLLLVFGLGVSAILWLHPDTGYVLISAGPWVIETSLAALLVSVALFFLLVYLALRLLGVAIRLPRSLREAIDRRRSDRARSAFASGLLSLFSGEWKRAEVELMRRAADHDAAYLNYLAAARAAQQLDAPDRRDHYLRLAALHKPELEVATLLTQAELLRRRGEHAAVKDAALRLRQKDPSHAYAYELLVESQAALGEWEAVRALLQEPLAQSALGGSRRDTLNLQSLHALMQAAVEAARLDRLKALWDGAAVYREDAALRRVYAHGLARLNADAEAAALIAPVLAREWDAQLLLLYGDLHLDPVTQLAAVEHWLNQYGETPELLQVAGRVCLRNRLWGKARSYLESALQRAPTAAACLDLARLCQDTQQPDEAARFYRQGLELATGAR